MNGKYFEEERQIVQRAVTRKLWVLPERVSPPPCRSFHGSVVCVSTHSWGYMRGASVGRREDTNRTRRGDPQKQTTTDPLGRLLLVYLETKRGNAGIRRRLGCRSQIYPVVVLRIRLECEILVIPQPDYQFKSTSTVSPRSSSLSFLWSLRNRPPGCDGSPSEFRVGESRRIAPSRSTL